MKVKAAAALFIGLYRLAAVRGHEHEHGTGDAAEDYAKRHVESDFCRPLGRQQRKC